MQFQVEAGNHGVARFFELYHDKLPLVVMVTQGFYGDIVEDTFDREQVHIFVYFLYNYSLFFEFAIYVC